MAEATQTQVETKPTPPDTTVVVTGATMQEYSEARTSGGEFKPADDPKPEPQVTAEEKAHVKELETPEHHPEADPKTGENKELTPKQIKANERWKAREEALTKERARADAAERQAQELKAKYEPPVQAPQVEPDPTKYTDAKAYAEDYANWKDAERQKTERAAKEQAHRTSTLDRFNKARDAFKATVDPAEWDRRSAINPQMHTEVINAMVESDYGAQMLFELSGDAELVKKINEMPNMRDRLRAIGRMEAKYEAAASGKPAPKAEAVPAAEEVEVSKAPEPIRPINGANSGAASRVDKDGNYTGTQAQFEADYAAGKLTRH